jgi:hypothetical protein
VKKTLKATLDAMREAAKSADIKIHRGFTDFLADRIIQATTEPTLLAMFEKLSALLNSKAENIDIKNIAKFIGAANNPHALDILNWLRNYPRTVGMIIMQEPEIYSKCINDIEIPSYTNEKGTALKSVAPDISVKITCLSPLSHGADTKAGNATIFRRMQVLSTTDQILNLPFYAGNAFRGHMRDLLADNFLQSLGLAPRRDNPPCNLWFFHALYAGGVLEENSAQAKALGKKLGLNGSSRSDGIHEFRDMIPPISVLGSALGNRVLPGKINVCDFRPKCIEWDNGETQVGNLFEWMYLTRREDHENHEHGHNSSMIANTECLKAGVVLFGGIDISTHANDIELGCVGRGLELLKESGYIGAGNRRGLGHVCIDIDNIPNSSVYDTYLQTNRLKITAYLEEIGAINAHG